jgi:enoyl-CoA hydratase/carnithine racemase
VWPEVIGEIRGRYFLLSGQKLSAAQAREYGAVNEIVTRCLILPFTTEHTECTEPKYWDFLVALVRPRWLT